MDTIAISDAVAIAVTEAIHKGDTQRLGALLDEHPTLASARIVDERGVGRTLLHIATDWPGNFPGVAEVIGLLVERGAAVDVRVSGTRFPETPLHWAASSDDVAAVDALLDHGADIEATGACIGGGTPMADAVAFAQWQAARRLLERGARTNLWQAAGLGLLDLVQEACAANPSPGTGELTNAFWCACHGGQQATAAFLLEQGADRDWVGYDGLTPLDAARRAGAGALVEWLTGQDAKSAKG